MADQSADDSAAKMVDWMGRILVGKLAVESAGRWAATMVSTKVGSRAEWMAA